MTITVAVPEIAPLVALTVLLNVSGDGTGGEESGDGVDAAAAVDDRPHRRDREDVAVAVAPNGGELLRAVQRRTDAGFGVR